MVSKKPQTNVELFKDGFKTNYINKTLCNNET